MALTFLITFTNGKELTINADKCERDIQRKYPGSWNYVMETLPQYVCKEGENVVATFPSDTVLSIVKKSLTH